MRNLFCLFAASVCFVVSAMASQTQVFAPGASSGLEPMYPCNRCTDNQYETTARTLGAGRHLLVDWEASAPRVCTVSDDLKRVDDACRSDAVTSQEQHRFELAKRLWAAPSPVHFREAEFGDLLRPREVDRTLSALALASGLRNDLSDALSALLPTRIPDKPGCKPGGTCAHVSTLETPTKREAVVDLARGGSVTVTWPTGQAAMISAIADAKGKEVTLPASEDFSTGQVYLYEGDVKAKARMVNYLRGIGFKMQVKADGSPFECRQVDAETVCRNIRVEARNFADLMQ